MGCFYNINRKYTPAEMKAFAKRAEADTRTCHVCGKPALYRDYDKHGKYFGACRAHKQTINTLHRHSFTK